MDSIIALDPASSNFKAKLGGICSVITDRLVNDPLKKRQRLHTQKYFDLFQPPSPVESIPSSVSQRPVNATYVVIVCSADRLSRLCKLGIGQRKVVVEVVLSFWKEAHPAESIYCPADLLFLAGHLDDEEGSIPTTESPSSGTLDLLYDASGVPLIPDSPPLPPGNIRVQFQGSSVAATGPLTHGGIGQGVLTGPLLPRSGSAEIDLLSPPAATRMYPLAGPFGSLVGSLPTSSDGAAALALAPLSPSPTVDSVNARAGAATSSLPTIVSLPGDSS